MDSIFLNLEERKNIGGGKVKRLRKAGYIPAVIYGRSMESIPTQIKASEFREFLMKHGKNSIFTTEFAAEQDMSVLVKDIQYDMLKNAVSHVDFQRVSINEKIHAAIPVRITGDNRLKGTGSVIVHQLDEVIVECLPQNVPHHLNADVSGMTPGHSLTAAQLHLPQGVTLVTEPGSVILAVTGGKSADLQVEKTDEAVVPKGEEGNVHAKRI
ncbi:MAG: 50S ribosomal protein L25 [Clostridia bacterium]|nr:50S ribosomal protein L25 [Clostridia bacterium]